MREKNQAVARLIRKRKLCGACWVHRATPMDSLLTELHAECDRAAREFLSIAGWHCPTWKVKAAVDEMRSGSPLASSRMGWLLRQTTDLPVQAEPNRRLHDLVSAISALRSRQNALPYAPPARELPEDLFHRAS